MFDNISVGGWCVCMETLAEKRREKLSLFIKEECKIDLVIKAKRNVHIVASNLEGDKNHLIQTRRNRGLKNEWDGEK